MTCRVQLYEARHHISTLVAKIQDITKDVPQNEGKSFDEVQSRQQRRKVAALREGIKDALWFCDSFGLDLMSVVFKSKAEKIVEIHYDKRSDSNSDNMEADKADDQVLAILYLLDRFGVSDQFYHEVSMVNPFIPRSYVIKRARERINNMVTIKRLPQPYFGCYRPFYQCIQEALDAQVHSLNYCF